MTTRTNMYEALGVRAMAHPNCVHEDDTSVGSQARGRLGPLVQLLRSECLLQRKPLQQSHSKVEGTGNKGMLESLVTLDVRKLEAWQLEEAETVWRDFRDRKFQFLPPVRCGPRAHRAG